MLFEYVAKRSIQTGHTAGETYTIYSEVTMDDYLPEGIGPAPSISTGGNQVTITHRYDVNYNYETTPKQAYQVTDILDMREFLDSVSGGESFTIYDGGENLINKATFEDGQIGDWIGTTSIASVDWGLATKVLQFTGSSTTYDQFIPVTAGSDTIYAEVWGLEDDIISGTLYCQAILSDGGGNFFEFTGSGVQLGTGSMDIPSGTDEIKLKFYNSGTGTAYITHPRLYRKSNPRTVVLNGDYSESKHGNLYKNYKFKVREL